MAHQSQRTGQRLTHLGQGLIDLQVGIRLEGGAVRNEVALGLVGGLHLGLKSVGRALGQSQAQFLGHRGRAALVDEQGVLHFLGLGVSFSLLAFRREPVRVGRGRSAGAAGQ
jgi:hypothetical protein